MLSSLPTRDSHCNDVLGVGRMDQWIKALSPWAWGPEFDPTSRQKCEWREPMMVCGLMCILHTHKANINNKINICFRIAYVQVGSCAVHCFESWQMHSALCPLWWFGEDDGTDLTATPCFARSVPCSPTHGTYCSFVLCWSNVFLFWDKV